MIYLLRAPVGIEDVEEVRVLEWHGEPGHQFLAGDLIVELETHKALIEVSAGQAGILRQTISAEGDWAMSGLPLAIFSDDASEILPEDSDKLAAMAVSFNVA